jgi:hypothetical protein
VPNEALDARVEGAFDALFVEIFLQVARHRGDDLDPMSRQKIGQVFKPGSYRMVSLQR